MANDKNCGPQRAGEGKAGHGHPHDVDLRNEMHKMTTHRSGQEKTPPGKTSAKPDRSAVVGEGGRRDKGETTG
jgi:hypothetical protein